jgi:hypothetical protein
MILVKVVKKPLGRAVCVATLVQPLFNELILGLGSFNSHSK